MTAAPAETCSVPSVRDAWQMWRDNQIDFAAIPHRCMSADGGCLSKLDTMCWQFRLPAYSCNFEHDHKERSIPMSQLMQACSPATTDELVDIREVAVDKALPKEERIATFLHQIKNPYRFRCCGFLDNSAFANNSVPLDRCLQRLFRCSTSSIFSKDHVTMAWEKDEN